ncbi:MAG: hypothetical protein WCL24_11930 [Verrucomicrobiota bacterium]|nr:hypothetical protein [Opitutales bacterium]
MNFNAFLGLFVLAAMVALALLIKPLRKTMGLLLVILGGIFCLTAIGLVIGVPMILVGGILLFV